MALGMGGLLMCTACKKDADPAPSAEPAQSVASPKAGDAALRQLDEEQLAERLIRASGGDQLGTQVFDQVMAQFSQSGMVTPEVVEKLRGKVNPSDFVRLIVPIYTKHLTEIEMIETIEFYESPTGKSMVSKLPLIVQDSLTVGQTWGAQLGQLVAGELQGAAEPTVPATP